MKPPKVIVFMDEPSRPYLKEETDKYIASINHLKSVLM